MKQNGAILSFLLSVLFVGSGFAQPSGYYVKRGDNVADLTCSSVTFSAATDVYFRAENAGAVWVKKQIDLKNAFDINFFVDYKDALTADGAAFVLQPDSNSLGASDNGLGYKGINHSIAVTFDAIQNAVDNDPAFDHMAIQANGDIDHNTSNNLAGPVSIEPFYAIQLNGINPPGITFMHMVRVKWDPIPENFSVYIDGNLLLAVRYDLVQKIFNGNPLVYWGFTASNTQKYKYMPNADIDLGHFSFYTGPEIYPRFDTNPELDTCIGTPITFRDKSIYGFDSIFHGSLLSKWYWDFGDGTASSLRFPPPHTYAAGGSYNVRYTIATQTGCAEDTVTRKITLGAKPIIQFTHSPGCVSSPVTFMDQSSAKDNLVVDWLWNFDNTYTSDVQNPVVSFTSTGIKTVYLKAGTNYGCTSDTTTTIDIMGRPSINFNFAQDCNGLVTYTGLLTDTVPANKWSWQFGDYVQSSAQSPSHQFVANGTYQTLLQAFSAGGCPSDSIKKTIIIDKLYPLAGNDTSIASGQPLQLHASGGGSYEWMPAAGLNNSGSKDPVAVLSASQSYVLLVRNTEGCEATDTINIKVYNEPGLYIPNAFTPNHDGKNDVFRITAPGIKQVYYFRIYNRWGVLLYNSTDLNKGWDGLLNGKPQDSGTYVWMVKAVDYNGKMIERKGTVTLIK